MKKMYGCILLLLFSLGNSYAGTNTKSIHWLEGEWEGTGGNLEPEYNWTITIAYKNGDSFIKLQYPSHSCGGRLTINTIEEGKASCIEDIAYGLGGCTEGLIVNIELVSDEVIKLSYYYADKKNTLKSLARLHRISR